MTTLAEYVTWATFESKLKTYLGVTGTAEDTQLEWYLEISAEMGDHYLGREFLDSAGGDIDPPQNTVIGCFAYVKGIRDFQRHDGAVTEKKTASLTEKYGNIAKDGGQDLALRQARPFWDPWKLDPTLAGLM